MDTRPLIALLLSSSALAGPVEDGTAAANAGRYKEAVAAYEQACEAKLAEALKFFRKACKTMPEHMCEGHEQRLAPKAE